MICEGSRPTHGRLVKSLLLLKDRARVLKVIGCLARREISTTDLC